MIEEAAWSKTSLLLKIQMQRTQTSQLFTRIIEKESIYKSYKNAKLKGLVSETKLSN
jgi:hypothetical protein